MKTEFAALNKIVLKAESQAEQVLLDQFVDQMHDKSNGPLTLMNSFGNSSIGLISICIGMHKQADLDKWAAAAKAREESKE